MSADSAQAAERPRDVRTRLVAAIEKRERGFWIGLACASMLHAVLIAGAVRSLPRQMGEASGAADGISVELVDAADLKAKNTFAEEGGQPAAQPSPQQVPQKQAKQEPPQPPQPQEKAEAQPT